MFSWKYVLSAFALVELCLCAKHMHVLYQWKSVDFLFPNKASREAMIRTGKFIPGNAVALDVDVWNKDGEEKIFVTFPRFKPGTPTSLGIVSKQHSGDPKTPLIVSYPDWSWAKEGVCDGITSVFRVQVDPCGRLWVLDTGRVDIFDSMDQICPAQILVFDIRTNKLLQRYRIPEDDLKPHSVLATIVVDAAASSHGKCRPEAYAYVADVTGFGLIVFDSKRERSWRVNSNLMYPYPPYGYFNINGESFDLMDGLLGLALGPTIGRDRTLYFHSLASVKESWVSTSVLLNSSLFEHGTNTAQRKFHLSQEDRSSQAAAIAVDDNQVLFFNPLADNSINCWNTRKPYLKSNLVELDRDDVTLQFASGMKIIKDKSGHEHLWVLTSRFQKLMTGTMTDKEVNYRILTAPIADLVRGTECDVRSNTIVSGSHGRPGYRPIQFRQD